MAKVLVLGGDGFIGSHLIDFLVKRGHDVVCYTWLGGKPTINLGQQLGKIKIVDGDFFNLEQLDQEMEGIDYVVHMISFSTPASSIDDHLLDLEKNVKGTIKLLELCVKHKIKKVIYPSSGGAIYGDHPELEKCTENTPTDPIAPYGISKLTIEKYLHYFKHMYGLDYLALRISNPYGERQQTGGGQGLIGISLNAIKNNLPLKLFGDGSNVRDYIYIKDLAEFIADIFDKTSKFTVYNLGSGTGTTISQIFDIFRQVTGKDFKVEQLPERKSDIHSVVLDISRIQEEFGFNPKVGLEEGIKLTWEYLNGLK